MPIWRTKIEYYGLFESDLLTAICSKISKSVNIMFQLKPSLSKPSLINRYYSLYLTYGCVFWRNYGGPLSLVIKLQNKALGIIDDVPLMDPSISIMHA